MISDLGFTICHSIMLRHFETRCIYSAIMSLRAQFAKQSPMNALEIASPLRGSQ